MFCGNLAFFPVLVYMLYQEKSGNPALRKFQHRHCDQIVTRLSKISPFGEKYRTKLRMYHLNLCNVFSVEQKIGLFLYQFGYFSKTFLTADTEHAGH
jgi:hypothetical protein